MKNFEEALDKLAEYIEKDLQKIVPVDTGGLAQSISFKFENGAILFEMNDYVKYANDGTKPHRPPIDAISGWAKRHNINVWALAKSIETYGTKAQNFFDKINDESSHEIDIDARDNPDIVALKPKIF